MKKKTIIKLRTKEEESARQEIWGSVFQAKGTTLTMAQRWDRLTGRTETKPGWLEKDE